MSCFDVESEGDAVNGTSSAGLWALNPVSLAWEAAWLEWQHNASLAANISSVEPNTEADDSVRCRHSRICEGAAACSADAGEHNQLLWARHTALRCLDVIHVLPVARASTGAMPSIQGPVAVVR